MNMEKRLEALELITSPKPLKMVKLLSKQDGNESDEDCIRRHGHNPEDKETFFIILVPR